MKNLFLGLLLIMLIFSCTEPMEILTESTETIIVKDGTVEFCDYTVLNYWAWDSNDDTWYDLDLSSYTDGQAVVEIILEFVDSDDPGIDACSISIRKDASSQEYSINANSVYGIQEIITDVDGFIQWKHDMNVDVSRKINFVVKLTMIQK